MMATYEYTATDQAGNEFSGTYDDVDNVAVLRQELEKMGYVLRKARRGRAPAKKRRKVKRSEVVAFAYKFCWDVFCRPGNLEVPGDVGGAD